MNDRALSDLCVRRHRRWWLVEWRWDSELYQLGFRRSCLAVAYAEALRDGDHAALRRIEAHRLSRS